MLPLRCGNNEGKIELALKCLKLVDKAKFESIQNSHFNVTVQMGSWFVQVGFLPCGKLKNLWRKDCWSACLGSDASPLSSTGSVIVR